MMADAGGRAIPLCVDLDGTLIRTDMLHETMLLLARSSALAFLRLPAWLVRGKAAFKHRIGEHVSFDPAGLPYRGEVIDLIEAARADGRPIVLATAAAPAVAQRIADHLGFDAVLSSSDRLNLSGARKAELLVARFGERGFDYVGNDRNDLAVLPHARNAYMVCASERLFRAAARAHAAPNWVRTTAAGPRAWAKALRVHQWVKNALIFVPLLAAKRTGDLHLFADAILAFISYSLFASAVYLVNDMLDLPTDRLHRTKRERPFAAGTLPIAHGAVAVPVLVAASWGIAAMLPIKFMIVLGVYAVATTLYSFWLKRQVVVDVMLLAGLYTLRILAGAAATDIEPSFWLLAFSMFVFLCLAMVKRYSELRLAVESAQTLAGRGYLPADLPVVLAMGAGSGLVSVLILALYTQSEIVPEHYPAPQWLWLVPPLMLYWVVRIWMKVNRGELNDDPVLFCVKDWQSIFVFACIGAMFLLAGAGWHPW